MAPEFFKNFDQVVSFSGKYIMILKFYKNFDQNSVCEWSCLFFDQSYAIICFGLLEKSFP